MYKTDIIRRADDLGRVAIPVSICKKLYGHRDIADMEFIFAYDKDGSVILTPVKSICGMDKPQESGASHKECACTAVFSRIADTLNSMHVEVIESITPYAMHLCKQMYDNAVALFDSVGFDIQFDASTCKHIVKYKSADYKKTNLF